MVFVVQKGRILEHLLKCSSVILLRFISYPRTETNVFPKELNLSTLVQQQTQDPNWGAFAQRILDQGGPTPRSGTKSDQAHPPIHPTKYAANLQVSVAKAEERAELYCLINKSLEIWW